MFVLLLILMAFPVGGNLPWQPPPSFEEMQQRAASLGTGLHVEQATRRSATPVFLLRNFLSQNELGELRAYFKQEQRPGGKVNSFYMTKNTKAMQLMPPEASQLPKELAVMNTINKRLSVLIGLPESTHEKGLFHGHSKEVGTDISLHLDNNKDGPNSARFASSVVYIAGRDQGIVGGQTVFPLQDFGHGKTVAGPDPALLAKWDSMVNSVKEKDKPAKKRFGRICAWDLVMAQINCGKNKANSCADCGGAEKCNADCQWKKRKCVAMSPSPCRTLVRMSKKICDENATSHMINPNSGDAILFYHHDAKGDLTMKAIHGTCPTTSGLRVSLSKFTGYPPDGFPAPQQGKSEL